MKAIYHQPAHVLRDEILNGRLTSEALTKIYLDRIESVGARVNAIAEIDESIHRTGIIEFTIEHLSGKESRALARERRGN